MNKYVVPQFIDVESKIFGPITTRQFIIALVGAMIAFFAYRFSDFSLFIVEAIIIAIGVGLFGFVKVNGAPFYVFLLNYISTLKLPAQRIWRRDVVIQTEAPEKVVLVENTDDVSIKKKLPPSRLSELSLIIDTGGVYQGERITNQDNEE
ncbi:MAG: PrgI family protein [Candidatus Komeilibacteria bacterium]